MNLAGASHSLRPLLVLLALVQVSWSSESNEAKKFLVIHKSSLYEQIVQVVNYSSSSSDPVQYGQIWRWHRVKSVRLVSDMLNELTDNTADVRMIQMEESSERVSTKRREFNSLIDSKCREIIGSVNCIKLDYQSLCDNVNSVVDELYQFMGIDDQRLVQNLLGKEKKMTRIVERSREDFQLLRSSEQILVELRSSNLKILFITYILVVLISLGIVII